MMSNSRSSNDDERAVREALDAVYAAWAENDADAFVEPYADDATALLPGVYLPGRETIRAAMADVFQGPLRDSRAIHEVQSIRFPRPGTAVVINKGALVPAGATEPSPGTRSLETWVLARHDGRWRVVAFQNSAEAAPAPRRDAVKEMYLEWTANRIRGEQNDPESWGDLTAEPRGVDYVETEAAGFPALWAVPTDCAEERVLLCLHGGGFVGGSIYTHRKLFGHLAKAAGARALMFDYRLVPEHTHPAPVDDVATVYRWLLEQGIEADHVAFAGDSSGGALSVTGQLRAREQGLPLPAAAAVMSPWVDMEASGETYRTNWASEAYFYRELVQGLASMFLGADGDPRDPLASPVFADLTGLAPLYVQVGGDETLLDDSRRLADRARAAGVDVRLDVFGGQQHTFQMAAGHSPVADDAVRRIGEWLRPRLGLENRAAAGVAA
jgi:uncharacterized protein (TIGR02246 family)